MNPNDKVTTIKGIGSKAQENLAKLNIMTIGDLLMHFPRDYKTYEAPVMPSCMDYDEKGQVAVKVHVSEPAGFGGRGKKSFVFLNIRDQGTKLEILWYNSPFIRQALKPGDDLIMYGRITRKGSRRMMIHPEMYRPEQYESMMNTMQPVYDLTEGISQHFFSKYIGQVLNSGFLISEYLPAKLRSREKLCELNYAIHQIHFPDSSEHLMEARKRLVFDEFFIFVLSLKLMKREKHQNRNEYPADISRKNKVDDFISGLPYRLTNAQQKVWDEISADMEGPHVMNRLVQGDVGSGKTMIAALAMLYNCLSGYQSCLMAPTEVLAKQHFENLSEMMLPYGVRIVLLTGSMTQKQKKEAYRKIQDKEADLIIGTQALFQEKVIYHCLTLIITDEQHRFGVHQREMLAEKSIKSQPHILVMSATPIPRTLAIVLYSDLDISVIDEKPVGRLPIKNCVVGTSYRKTAYRFMQNEIQSGRQIYIICPMVEENENIDAEDVTSYTQTLKKVFPSEVKIAMLHGRMKPDEKNQIMEDFAAGKTDILVSTTVIEVGVDVSNATVMMIENAERFGLAQLHQLRGRVGRGQDQSYCIFMYGRDDQKTKERLDVMLHTNDGFKIAAEDLKMRGPGDMFGIRQSGLMNFRIGDVFNDASLLIEAGKAADEILKADPDLSEEENQMVADKVKICMQGNETKIIL